MAVGDSRRIFGWFNAIFQAALALVAVLLLIVLATLPSAKALWDLSPQARFSVESATKDLLAGILRDGKKVEIHTIFEPLVAPNSRMSDWDRRRIDIHKRLQDLTIDLLRQYDYLGGDSVSVTHVDLRQEPAKVREVLKEIKMRRSNTIIVKLDKRWKTISLEADVADIDFGATTQSGVPGSRRSMPILKDYKGEEAISSAIKSLLVEGSPKIYFLTGHGEAEMTRATAGSYSMLLTDLEAEGFEIDVLDLEKEGRVPEDAQIVALIEPKHEMSEQAAEALVSYLRRGGRLFANVAWYELPRDWNVGLVGLGKRLGFEVGERLVCHLIRDPRDPHKTQMGSQEVQNLMLVKMNPVHEITRPLMNRQRYPQFVFGREIRALEPNGLEGVRVDTSFLNTDSLAWLEDRVGAQGQVDYVVAADRSLLAPRCVGALIDVDSSEDSRLGHAIVMSAQGFHNTRYQVNGDLGLNIFNWLAERRALVSVRGDRYVSRRLEVVPQQLSRVRWLLVGGVPGGLFLLGLIVFWVRKRE